MLQPNRRISQKHHFSGTKTFWVTQNNSLSLECNSKINKRKNVKQISAFDFSTLYTEIPHDKLLANLYKVADCVFKGGNRDYLVISKQGCAYGHLRQEDNTSLLLNHCLKNL